MQFTTIDFALFFLIVLIVNWSLRRYALPYKLFLLAANYFFYGYLDIRFLLLVLAITISNYVTAYSISKTDNPKHKKVFITVDIIINLAVLGIFKYYEFFYNSLEEMLIAFGLQNPFPILEIVFPIGISFYTFQGLSYAIDVYRQSDRVAKNPLDVFVYISFFPTILAGPILRSHQFVPQLQERTFDYKSFKIGFMLILSGLFKKVVLSSYLSEHIVRDVFQVPESFSSLTVLMAVYGYCIQIFCDFSGYSDLAIGLALLLGFKLPDNFNDPYRSTNMQEFWRRWHISFSTWLRDYLYIPLGGNRKGITRKYLNLMITMILGGIWHGAHFNFIIWGALHGGGLVGYHYYKDSIKPKLTLEHQTWKALGKILGWVLTFHFVSFAWIFFRADSTPIAFEIIQSLFAFRTTGTGFEFYVIPAILVGLLIQFFGHHIQNGYLTLQSKLPVYAQGLVISIICIIIIQMGPDLILPFIYFSF